VSPASEFGGAIAPNGRWLAYHSNETGRDEVYVQQFPSGGLKQQISSNGGRHPRWRRDGRGLFFLSGNRLMRMDVDGAAACTHGQPQELLTVKGFILPTAPYDVSPTASASSSPWKRRLSRVQHMSM
jgi:Tol biopolymer transport system component